MVKPTLCAKHFYRVANYFDKRLAIEFEIDGENCLVCSKTMNVEMARWFVQQNAKESTAATTLRPLASRIQF
jgi:hypothetical protein